MTDDNIKGLKKAVAWGGGKGDYLVLDPHFAFYTLV